MVLDKKSHIKQVMQKIVGKHIQYKRTFVPLMGNSAANVEDQIIFLLFVCHQKSHCEKRRKPIFRQQESGRDVRRAINESETDGSESDGDGDTHFIDETVRHL